MGKTKANETTTQSKPDDTAASTNATGSTLALAPKSVDEATLAALAEAGLDGEDADDGLGELNARDFKTRVKLYNQKNKTAGDGARVLQDHWFDSVDKTIASEINVVFLYLHKSNNYAVYDNAEKRNKRICASNDQVTGIWQADGHERKCKGCPDAVWKIQQDGKRRANCSEVWSMFSLDLDTREVTMVQFKRTSMDPIREYMSRYHFGKRPLPGGKRGHLPAFLYRVRMTLVMDKSGNFAVPVIERGEQFQAVDLKVLAETSAAIRDSYLERLNEAEASVASVDGDGSGESEGGAPDASFDYGANVDASSGSKAFTTPS